MFHIPLALPVVLAILALSIIAYQYWDRNPEKAQRSMWRTLRLVRRLVMAPISAVLIAGMFAVYLAAALLYFLPRHVLTGRQTEVVIKLT